MSDSADADLQRLGIILPDDGGGGYEWWRVEHWLAARGASGIAVDVSLTGPVGGHERDALFAAGSRKNLAAAADRLAAVGAEALVWACTSGSFIGGLAWSQGQTAWLETRTRRPATTATLAMIAAARAFGTKAVDVLGPYPAPITRRFADCLAEAGFEVGVVRALGAPDGPASLRLDIHQEIARFAQRHPGQSSPLLLPDTAVNSLEFLDQLEATAGRPVITANQACLWAALRRLFPASLTVNRAGMLFRSPAPIDGFTGL